MNRLIYNLFRGSQFDDPAFVHDRDPVAEVGNQIEIMGDEIEAVMKPFKKP